MDAHELHELVSHSAGRVGTPGMAVGVSEDGRRLHAVSGVRNALTGDPTTADTMFQIGSVTKMYTATLVMRLVDRGLLRLDDPVDRHLPELGLAGDVDTSTITVEMLLTHTSGIEGDCFFDTGRGDDAIERIVPRLAEIGLIHAPGQAWSYCNTGFVLAGRIVEKLTGTPFHQALTDELVTPLGATGPIALLDDLVQHRIATGHVPDGDGWAAAPLRRMPWSQASAGSRPFASVDDLLTFGAMHADGGRAASGAHVVSADSIAAMQQHRADQPRSATKGQGLGWFLLDEAPVRVLVHAGDTAGFASMLVVVPERRLVIATLTNSNSGAVANSKVVFRLLREHFGIAASAPGSIEAEPDRVLDLAAFAGTYRRVGVSAVVSLLDDGSGLRVVETFDRGHEDLTVRESTVVHHGSHVFVDASGRGEFMGEFTDLDADGRAQGLVSGLRLLRRAD